MPLFRRLLKGGGPTLENALILRRMSLNITPRHNPFHGDDDEGDGEGSHWSPGSSLLDGDAPRDRNPFEDEEDENEANEGRKGGDRGGSAKASFKLKSPLKSLGKLGKSLRSRTGTTPSPQGAPQGSPSPAQRKKKGRRSSEGSLLRFAGRYRDSLGSRKDSLVNGEQNASEADGGGSDAGSQRLSFRKMVGLGKLKRESQADQTSQAPEEQPELDGAPQEEVKPREPLSVLEILQLVKRRDLYLADTHILELERECVAAATEEGVRRKAKDVELLYEELQKELWAVVRQALHAPATGPALGLVVQVLQQEDQADPDRAAPRQLTLRWREAVEQAADAALPPEERFSAGELDHFLDRVRNQMVEDLGAATRNLVSVYPEEFQPFKVYMESYHQAVARRLTSITEQQLEISDIYSLLDWLHNVYDRDVLGTVCVSGPPQLRPLLSSETLDRLELDCLNSVRATVTTEMSQLLENEEKRWTETLEDQDLVQLSLSSSVIQRLQLDLERSASINRSLGSRVAQCIQNGLADFLYSFQRKAELFHEAMQSGLSGDSEDAYVSKTIALVNCCPPFRGFVQRCSQSDPSLSEDSFRRANKCLDHIVQQGVRVLTERLFLHIRPLFERLVKRKWLSNTEPLEQLETVVKETFKKLRRMDSPPYQLLAGEVHRRVVTEYLRAVMRGRIICTSVKMRKRTAGRLRDEGQQIKLLFQDLESPLGWLDGALPHLSEIVQLEDVPSIQMEVAVLVREFPDVRKKHVSAMLTMRGTRRQAERQEILNVVKDIESSEGGAAPSRHRLLFSDVPVTTEVHCLNLGLSRLALAASAALSSLRPQRRRRSHRRTPPPGTHSPEDGL